MTLAEFLIFDTIVIIVSFGLGYSKGLKDGKFYFWQEQNRRKSQND